MPYGPYPYEDFLTTRLIPDPEVPWRERMRGWVRMDSDAAAALSPCAVACVLLDTLPPGLFFDQPVPVFVPTVDFTAHFTPAVSWRTDAWVHLVAETRWATRDFCLDQAVLRTADGRLVAQAVQTRRVLWPEGSGPR
jgi:acyl-CoA thioesterase